MSDFSEQLKAEGTRHDLDLPTASEYDGSLQDMLTEAGSTISELRTEIWHCIYELERSDNRAPHRVRRAGLARKTINDKEGS